MFTNAERAEVKKVSQHYEILVHLINKTKLEKYYGREKNEFFPPIT